MRLSSILNILKEYTFIAIVLLLLISTLLFIGYFLIHKKTVKLNKTLNIKQGLLYGFFFIYIIIVLGATLGIRQGNGIVGTNFHIFSSYIDAWNSFSKSEWINIILNILMFVPLGILLPLIFESCKNFKITYILGLLCTLAIELTQLITTRGIFELDDILNNSLGCIIGYGLISIYLYFHKKKYIFYAQIPLLITVLSFAAIFIVYNIQELGNLSMTYSYTKSMSDVDVSTSLELNDTRQNVYVYTTYIGSKDDTLNKAKEIFSAVNATVDESKNNVYNDTIIYNSTDDKHSVWVDFVGLTSWYILHNEPQDSYNKSLTYDEVKKSLSSFNVILPEKPHFYYDEGSGYNIDSLEVTNEGNLLYGNLCCRILDDGTVSIFMNKLISYKKYKEFEIISEEEAYDKIVQGKFKSYIAEDTEKLNITNVNLSYKIDSKGFLQPVYKFTIADMDNDILIPAIA